jgi:hypothetical protein
MSKLEKYGEFALKAVVCVLIIANLGVIAYTIHQDGAKDGFEAGRYAEHEYINTKHLADSCYDLYNVYKAKHGYDPPHFLKQCDGIMATAKSYVHKPMQSMGDIY